MVGDVSYDNMLVEIANDNIKKITFWILVISGVLAFIAMLLINSSLRLSIYSHRFIIKTMQMVGATKSFIRKPFIWRGIKLGLIGSATGYSWCFYGLYTTWTMLSLCSTSGKTGYLPP